MYLCTPVYVTGVLPLATTSITNPKVIHLGICQPILHGSPSQQLLHLYLYLSRTHHIKNHEVSRQPVKHILAS